MSLIHTFRFEFTNGEMAEAREIQDKVFGICRHNLVPAIQSVVDQKTGRLDRVELDIGTIPFSSIDSQLIPRTVDALEKKLTDLDEEKEQIQEINHVEVLAVFLETGILHWSQKSNWNIAETVTNVLENDWKRFLQFLKGTRKLQIVATRIGQNFSPENFRNLVQSLTPVEAEFVLDFIHDITETTQIRNPQFWSETSIETELKTLVIIDLIRNHGSLFNRKMFVRSQLISISNRYRVDFAELLRFLEVVLDAYPSEFRLKSSLPFIIKSLIEDFDHPKLNEPITEKAIPIWTRLYREDATSEEIRELLSKWGEIIQSYPRELFHSLHSDVKTIAQVTRMVTILQDEKTNMVFEILEPGNYAFIVSYKAHIVSSSLPIKRLVPERPFVESVNIFIMSFLLLQSGSRFNRKQFVLYQIGSISQSYRLNFLEVLNILSKHLNEHHTDTKEFELIQLLKEIKLELSSEKIKVSDRFIEEESINLVKSYLLDADIKNLPVGTHLRDLQVRFKKLLLTERSTKELMAFIDHHKEEIGQKSTRWESVIYRLVVELLVSSKLKLKGTEKDELIWQINEGLKSNPGYTFKKALVISLVSHESLTRKQLQAYELHSLTKKSKSITFLYFQSRIDELLTDKKPSGAPTARGVDSDYLPTWIFDDVSDTSISAPQKKAFYELIIDRPTFFDHLLIHLEPKTWTLFIESLSSSERADILRSVKSKYGIQLESHPGTSENQMRKSMVALFRFLVDFVRRSQSTETFKKRINLLKELGFVFDKNVFASIERPEETWFSEFQQFMESGDKSALSDWSGFQAILLKWHTRSDRRYLSIIRSASLDPNALEKIANHLPPSILMRFLQVLTGGQFNAFMSASKDAEYLLEISGVDLSRVQSMRNWSWMVRLHYARLAGRNRPALTRLFHHFAHYVATLARQNPVRTYEKVVIGLSEKREEIRPMSLRKKVVEIIGSRFDHPEESSSGPEASVADLDITSIPIHNSGLILFWPFLSRLFGRLEMLNEHQQFKSLEDQHHACRLVNYIGSGADDDPEHQMTLSKLLVGLKLEDPLDKNRGITDDEANLIENMMHGLIDNWDKLGNTSLEALRNSFLLRKGSLEQDDGDWKLNVDRMGVDALLQFLPWGISSIKLPWTHYVLYVSW